MDNAERYDVLLTELKAAAIDVAAERALSRHAAVVFVDNRPTEPGLAQEIRATLDVARARHRERHAAR